MNLLDLIATVSLDTSAYTAGLSSLSTMTTAIGTTIGNLASRAISGGFSKISGFMKDTVDTGMEFDQAMANVYATLGKSPEEANKAKVSIDGFTGSLRDLALYMGETTVYTASDAAEALNYLALAGLDTEKSARLLPTVLGLASAGAMDLGDAARMVSTAMNSMGLDFEDTEKLVDQMAVTSQKTDTTVEEMGRAIKNVGPYARQLNGGMVELANGEKITYSNTTEMSAALGILASAGSRGAVGGTRLKNMLNSLITPTKTGADALAGLGYNLDEYNELAADSNGKIRPLVDIFADLREKLEGLTDEQKIATLKKIFGKQNVFAQSLIYSDRWDELLIKIEGAQKALADFWKEMEKIEVPQEKIESAFASIGVTAEEFQSAFEQSGGTLDGFLEMLDYFKDDGADINVALAAMGITMDDLEEAFNNTAGAAEAMADTKLDTLEGDLELMNDALDSVKIRISDELQPTIREFVDYVTGGLARIKQGIESGGIIGGLDALADWLEEAVELLDKKLDGIEDKLSPVLERLGEIIGKLIGKLIPIILPAAIKLGLGIQKGIAEGLVKSGGVGATIQTFIGLNIIGKIGGAILKIATFGKILSNVWGGAITPVMKTLGGIGSLISGAVIAVSNFVDMWKNGWNVIKSILMTIGIALAGVGAALLGVTAPVAAVVAAIVAVVANLVIVIKDHWSEIVEFFKGVWENIKSIAKSAAEWVSGVFVNAYVAVKTAWGFAKSFFSNTWSNIKNAFSNVVKWFSEIFSRAWDGVKKAWNTVGQFFGGIKDKIVNAFKSLPSKFVQVGKDLLTGLGNGLVEGAKSVVEKAKKVAGNVLSAVKGFFGVSSPSKVFHSIGGFLMEGLANGISDSVGMVENVMDDLDSLMFSEAPSSDLMSDTATTTLSYGNDSGYFTVPRQAETKQLTVVLELDRMTLGRAVYNLNSEETQRVGVRLAGGYA